MTGVQTCALPISESIAAHERTTNSAQAQSTVTRLTEQLQLGATVMKINDKAVVTGSVTVRGDGVSANSMGAVSLTVGFAR